MAYVRDLADPARGWPLVERLAPLIHIQEIDMCRYSGDWWDVELWTGRNPEVLTRGFARTALGATWKAIGRHFGIEIDDADEIAKVRKT